MGSSNNRRRSLGYNEYDIYWNQFNNLFPLNSDVTPREIIVDNINGDSNQYVRIGLYGKNAPKEKHVYYENIIFDRCNVTNVTNNDWQLPLLYQNVRGFGIGLSKPGNPRLQDKILKYSRIDIGAGELDKNADTLIGISPGVAVDLLIKSMVLIDLTLIYGEGNEPTTPEKFERDYKQWFGKELTYEEYDEGSVRKTNPVKVKPPKIYDAEVEYIEVSPEAGDAYITTQFVPYDKELSFFITFMPTGYANDSGSWFSTRKTTDNIYIVCDYINQSSDDTISVCFNRRHVTANKTHTAPLGIKHEVELLRQDKAGSYSVIMLNGEKVYWGGENAGEPQNNPIVLFNNYSYNAQMYGRLYSFKITHGTENEVIMDLIPVRKGTTGFMFDKISGRLYYNSGEGKFIVGPDKTILEK